MYVYILYTHRYICIYIYIYKYIYGIYIYIYLCDSDITFVNKRVLDYHIYRRKEKIKYVGEK